MSRTSLHFFKRILVAFLISIISITSIFAQSSRVTPSLIPYRKGDLWGYADRNHKILIPPVYEAADFFYGPVAKVRQNQKWALINKKGQPLTEFKYRDIYIHNGGIKFYEGNREGQLDTTGKEFTILPNATFYINQEGNKVDSLPLISSTMFRNGVRSVQFNGKTGVRYTLLDHTGKDLLPPEYDFHDTIAVNKSLFYIIRTQPEYYYNEDNHLAVKESAFRFGLLNDRFEFTIPVKYRVVSGGNNFVYVRDWFGKAGFWDLEKRRKLTRRRFDRIETTSHPARALVSSLSRQGLLDSTGKWILPLSKKSIKIEKAYQHNYQEFKSLGLKTPHLFFVFNKNKKTAVDPYGKELPAFNHGALEKIADSLFLVKQEPEAQFKKKRKEEYYYQDDRPKFGLMNAEGKILVKPAYRSFQNRPQNQLVTLTADSVISFFTITGERLADRLVVGWYGRTNQLSSEPINEVEAQELAVSNKKSCYHIQQPLANGLTIVGNSCLFKAKTYGVINKGGQVVVPFHYNEIFPLAGNNLIVRQADKWGVIKVDGSFVLSIMYDKVISLESGNLFAGINSDFREIIIEGGEPSRYYQLRDSTGALLTDVVFLTAPVFKGETAWVPIIGGSLKLDHAGKILARVDHLRHRFEEVRPGIYRVSTGNSWEFIDVNGNTVIPPQFDEVLGFKEGLAAVRKGGKWGYIDKKGQVVIPFKFEEALPFYQGKAFVRTLNEFRLINRKGAYVSAGTYQEVQPFTEGLAAVKRHNKWGFIDENEKLVIPFNYGEVSSFSNGMAIYSINNRLGYVNLKGKQIVPPRYSELQPFQKDSGWMEKYGTWYLANRKGRIIDSTAVRPYQKSYIVENVYWKNNRLFKNDQNQLILKGPKGQNKVLGYFDKFQFLSEGLIGVQRRSGYWYYIDENGIPFFKE